MGNVQQRKIMETTMWSGLFDIDGTLIRTGGAGLKAIEAVLRRRFQIESMPKVAVHGRTDTGIWQELFSHLRIPLPDDLKPYFSEYCERLSQTLKRNDGVELPGCREILRRLSTEPRVKVGLLTGNVRAAANIKMEVFDMDQFFDGFGGFGDDFACRNHVAKQAVESAQKSLGIQFDPSKVVVIGDTVKDIECGKHIGARVIAVATGGDREADLVKAKPDYIFEDLSDVERFIRIFEESR
ncbi:MAG: HAD hydrolase-like protein [Planctomycetota bacterium]